MHSGNRDLMLEILKELCAIRTLLEKQPEAMIEAALQAQNSPAGIKAHEARNKAQMRKERARR
jgi:hypothetical protein